MLTRTTHPYSLRPAVSVTVDGPSRTPGRGRDAIRFARQVCEPIRTAAPFYAMDSAGHWDVPDGPDTDWRRVTSVTAA